MSIEAIGNLDGLRAFLGPARSTGHVIGLVPTMGALHGGHGALIDRARAECDRVIVSVYVNPTQFGAGDDMDRYPRRSEDDVAFCEARGVDAVFAPSDTVMYPDALHTWVEPGVEAQGLCGKSRPGHFRAVATVVLKLIHAVGPNRAYFGEKDLQQLAVIRRMVADLNVPVEIVACPTHREPDGLAASSRNGYLDSGERAAARVLYRALRAARQRIADGGRDPKAASDAALAVIASEPMARVDYLEVVGPDDMQPVSVIQGPVRVAGAVWIGGTRLIDNVPCDAPRGAPAT